MLASPTFKLQDAITLLDEQMYCTLTLGLLLALVTTAPLEPNAAPLVAGYERFFRESGERSHMGAALLLSELSCTACHATDDAQLSPKRGPRLDGVGRRLQHEWMLQFIAAPQAVKPGTTMPDILHLKSPEV